MAKRDDTYNADAITILEGLEAVRRRPGMYIGSVSSKGLNHLVYEIVDNAVDEHLAGYCTEIYVTLNQDGSVTVKDNGRGIPVGINSKTGRPAVEVVFTVLHAGGKFGDGNYKISGGLHGVGASVVNALSEWLTVDVRKDGIIYNQRFERGRVCYPLRENGTCRKSDSGSTITFLPDKEIFDKTYFKAESIKSRLHETAYLNPDGKTGVVQWETGTPVAVVEKQNGYWLLEGKGQRGWVREKYIIPDQENTSEGGEENGQEINEGE